MAIRALFIIFFSPFRRVIKPFPFPPLRSFAGQKAKESYSKLQTLPPVLKSAEDMKGSGGKTRQGERAFEGTGGEIARLGRGFGRDPGAALAAASGGPAVRGPAQCAPREAGGGGTTTLHVSPFLRRNLPFLPPCPAAEVPWGTAGLLTLVALTVCWGASELS